MSECDAAGETEMDQLMRTIPPMDATVAAELLREAKEVFDELGVVFFLRQGTCLGAVRDAQYIAPSSLGTTISTSAPSTGCTA